MIALTLLGVLLAAPGSIDPPAGPKAFAPNLRLAGEDVLSTWVEPVGSDRHRVRFSRLSGARWSPPVTIVDSDRIWANWADVPSIAAAADGTLYAHWAQRSGAAKYAYDVALARSTDGGRAWTVLGVPHHDGTQTEHGFASLVADGASQVLAVWLDGRQTAGSGPMTIRSASIGEQIGKDRQIEPRVCDCCATDAAVTADGPVVVYRDRSDGEVRDISILRRVKGRWSAPSKVSADGWKISGCPVNGPSIDAHGRDVVVAWYTGAGGTGRVRAVFSDDAGATFSPAVEVVRGGRPGPVGRVDVVLESPGVAQVLWLHDDGDGQGALKLKRVARTGADGRARVLVKTSPERKSGVPRMVRRGSGLFVMWTQVGAGLRGMQVGLDASVDDRPAPAEGRRAADPRPVPALGAYTARTLDGHPVALAAQQKKQVVLHRWATWCIPCRRELKALARLHARHGKRFELIAVSIDPVEADAEVRAFVKAHGIRYTVWRDPDDRLGALLGVRELPSTHLLDRKFKVVRSHAGAIGPGWLD